MYARTLAGRYRMDSLFRDNSLSTVFRGWDEETRKPIAIKALKLEGLSADEAKQARQVCLQEINFLKGLKSPLFPEYVDFLMDDKNCFIIMEWIEGKDLQTVMKEKPQMTQDGAMWYIEKIARTLTHLQEMTPPLIYKDLKPSDIMVDKSGGVRILDFSSNRIGKALNEMQTGSAKISSYIAPELVEDDSAETLSSDVFSLGAIIFQMVTGENPSQFAYRFPPPNQYNPELSEKFNTLVTDCLAPQERRIPDFAALVKRIEGIHAVEEAAVQVKKQNPMESPIFAAIIFVGALIVQGAAFFIFKKNVSPIAFGAMTALAGPYIIVFLLYKLVCTVRTLRTKQRHEMDLAVLLGLTFLGNIAGGVGAFVFISGQSTISEAKMEVMLAGCENNLKTISIALEHYADDHKRGYPSNFKLLVPKYLEEIPKCPACGKDTYSASYYSYENHSRYKISCKGENHKAYLKLKGDWPQYTEKGLARYPGGDDIFRTGQQTSPKPEQTKTPVKPKAPVKQ